MRLEFEVPTGGTYHISWCSTPYNNDTRLKIEDDVISKGGERDMMGLYEVYVVDKKTLKHTVYVVDARNEERAKLKVARMGLKVGVGELGDDEDNIEYFVRCIGQWESRKPKEVKIVKEE